MSVSPLRFFKRKKQWSKYKDGILGYYLKPYLAKVACLQKPITIVDCFARPGRFGDGEPGSPLIVLERLSEARARGVPVETVLIEKNKTLHAELVRNTADTDVPVQVLHGDFHQYIELVAEMARTHSVFVYLDPIRPKHLLFDDMAIVYDRLYEGASVETLVNFMSTAFWRGAASVRDEPSYRSDGERHFDPSLATVETLDTIAGGDYWQSILLDGTLTKKEQIDRVAQSYGAKLERWFKWRILYAIRERYSRPFPKYHLVFGSRSEDALELMNDAMVRARRGFVRDPFVDGNLFDNTPAAEVIPPAEVELVLMMVIADTKKLSWKMLRVHTAANNPARYLQSDINKGIKALIKAGRLQSNVDGSKIENNAQVWV